MSYVYHRKPHGMVGTQLYPLNQLKTAMPEVYEFQAAKYKGREALMEEVIPLLDCKWNDVIHFAPIDPCKVFQAVTSLGGELDAQTEWFKIPVAKLKTDRTAVFLYERETAELVEDQLKVFDASDYSELLEVPQPTIEWYQDCIQRCRRPLLFHRVPHVLTLDVLDVADCEIVTWGG